MNVHTRFLSAAQLRTQLQKCEFCEEKPCREGCPAHCSPADFIQAARVGSPSDIQRAAAEIMMANPFGGVCGLVCPDHYCKEACSHRLMDGPVEIPSVQATLVQAAKELGVMPRLDGVESSGHRVAVVGAGPAGLAAAAMLARKGHAVTVYDENNEPGGACRSIPEHRLPVDVLDSDIAWLLSLGDISFEGATHIVDPAWLLEQDFEAVVVAAGITVPIRLGIEGEEQTVEGLSYLRDPEAFVMVGNVVVVGGGATAVDCAVTARMRGAARVEMICLERHDEMPLSASERHELAEWGVEITGRTRLVSVKAGKKSGIKRIITQRVTLPPDEAFSLKAIVPVKGTKQRRQDVDHVIVAIGARSAMGRIASDRIFYAGDQITGPGSVVMASASGKNAAFQADAFLRGEEPVVVEKPGKCRVALPGYNHRPVSLATDFFGRTLRSPFLLSAAPPSDGYEQMKKAYEAGWAGGVMKTAFDGVPIHIPGEYMHVFDAQTYGNCDNVSGHSLTRVCDEIRRLVAEYPDRLTVGSTGGPVSGNDEQDKAGWQSNTRKLEEAGAMAIEYSLSCPQGGDGTEGDIVSQNPRLTAKIIDWIMEISNPEIPKLFKLTAAVTSIEIILRAIAEVLARYPDKKAGVTLANTFPVVNFRPGNRADWDEGVVVGMSGAGVAPISNFTLSRAGREGIAISGNGGAMDYRSAAHFLALGCGTVQFCTLVMKHGYGIIGDLESGLSHMMARRGIPSVSALVGRIQPHAITDFMALTPVKKISQVDADLCLHCGNCTRCPYLAISLNEDRVPVTDASRCIGCSICAQKCFASALFMRERSAEELELLREE